LTAVAVGFGFLAQTVAYAQDLAYVRSASSRSDEAQGHHGSAWLFHRGGVCYAATPRHLFIGEKGTHRDDRYARVVVVRPGRSSIEAQGDRCAVFRDHDLALVRVSGVADLADCGSVLIGQSSVDPLLAVAAEASLRTATESGSFVRRALGVRSARVNDPDHFWVSPSAERDELTRTMSGGHVTIQDRLAGFLLGVSDEHPTQGMAKVLRSDRVSVLLTRLFGDSSQASVDSPPCLRPTPDGPATAAALRTAATGNHVGANRAARDCGASVRAWSSPPISPAFRPDHLVGVAEASGRWRAQAAEEVTVDVRLCGPISSPISRLRFVTSGCPSEDNASTDVEVIVLGPSLTPVTSLGYARVPASGVVEIGGAPVLGRDLRLRFITRSQGSGPVCAGPLFVE